MQQQPNIIFIITDQQRYDHLGCNGHPVIKTPNIDRLAQAGISLPRHYCNHPLCTPSRVSILTGRYPRSHRVYDNGGCLPASELTMPQVLNMHGYGTHAIGKLHFSSWREPNAVSFESESFWASGRAPKEPVPYAGFDLVEICTRHINPATGHYGQWLQRAYPEVRQNWDSYLKPHGSGAPDTYDWTMPPAAHANTWIADRACDYLRQQTGSGSPFFLHVGFPDPHHPFRAPDPWGSMYDPAETVLPDNSLESNELRPPEYRRYLQGNLNIESLGSGDFNNDNLYQLSREQLQAIHAKTYGMISFVDEQVGRILDVLEATGQRQNTVIIYTSDHGDLMGDHGLVKKGPFLLEGLMRVPLLLSLPPHLAGGLQPQGLTSHVDIMPTLLALAGITIPAGVEGHDFLPQLRGDAGGRRNRVLMECLHQFQFDRNVKGLVTDNWKIIYWGGQPYGELYDMANDPQERRNLWDDPAHAGTRSALLAQLLDELVVTENILPLPLAPT
ncbi:MAG: sulfatase [Kiritimatiellia bacterium]